MSYLYVLRDGDAYKLGVTNRSAAERRGQLQTGNPRDLEIVYEFKANDPYAVESELHNIFAPYEIPTGGNEWFEFKDLSPLHVELNRLISERRIASTGRYTGDVNYLHLISRPVIWIPAISVIIASILFLIWSGALL